MQFAGISCLACFSRIMYAIFPGFRGSSQLSHVFSINDLSTLFNMIQEALFRKLPWPMEWSIVVMGFASNNEIPIR